MYSHVLPGVQDGATERLEVMLLGSITDPTEYSETHPGGQTS